MIDLSITKDPEWIKQRELLWKPIGESFGEGLRKKDVEKIHHYFMTGILREGEELIDGAKFSWFPIQTPEAWDYIFEHIFDSKDAAKEFEQIFYFQFGDLSGRALNQEQELALWDYFAGDTFKPVVTSRVPVGKEKGIVSFNVRQGTIAAKFSLFMDKWVSGSCGVKSKWSDRIKYFLTFLESVQNDSFLIIDGKVGSKEGACVGYVFDTVANPTYGDDEHKLEDISLHIRQDFITHLRNSFDDLNMPQAMRALWEETKAKHGV
jgi:hypothetical protein